MEDKPKTDKTDQKGAILVTLIVAMVIMAMTASGMLYFSTTSSYGELLANRQARAYYVAESGVNYALQQYLTAGTLLAAKNISFLNSDKFEVTSVIVSKPGTPAVDWLVIKSTGTVGSGWLTTRQVVTKEIKKALATPPGIPPVTTDASGVPLGFDANANAALDTTWTPTAGTDTGIVSTGPSGGPALMFKGDVGAIDLSATAVAGGLAAAWASNGNLLSYFLQVKVNIDSQGSKGQHYLMGLSFRKGSSNSIDNFYGLSFYRSRGLSGLPAWCTTAFTGVIPNNNGEVYAVLWKNSGTTKTVLAYESMATYVGVTYNTNQTLAAWPTLLIRVNERFDGPGGVRRNHLKAYVTGPSLGTLNWNLSSFKPVTWTWVSAALNPNNQSANVLEILEDTFTSVGFTNIASRPEIGVHAYYDSNAANDQFFNGFGAAIQGTSGGSVTY